MVQLSVLDTIPVRRRQSTSQAISASLALAKLADRLSYARYWVSEKHNMPSHAATSPAIMAGLVASATAQIPVGSGGLVLANHGILDVAENFAFLEAAFPGRIDLGVLSGVAQKPAAISQTGLAGAESGDMTQHLHQLIELLSERQIRITPTPGSRPLLWLLGSDEATAQAAARLGLPFVFLAHRTTINAAEILQDYRDSYQGDYQPFSIVTANVVVAKSEEEAQALALPYRITLSRAGEGLPDKPLPSVEDALNLPEPDDAWLASTPAWVVGTPSKVAEEIFELAGRFGADEVMLRPMASARLDDPLDRYPAREFALAELMPLLGNHA